MILQQENLPGDHLLLRREFLPFYNEEDLQCSDISDSGRRISETGDNDYNVSTSSSVDGLNIIANCDIKAPKMLD